MLQLLEPVPHLQSLPIDPRKIKVILQTNHMLRKLAIRLLPLVTHVELLL